MNADRVKVLINIYLDKYDEMAAADERVLGTWTAVNTCRKHWDMDADDFGRMFHAAMRDASLILENETWKPLEGIRYLCDNDRQEEVRASFRELLARDDGDIEARQGRVLRFVRDINDMLIEAAPERWQLRQKIRTGIQYLGIIDPSENYIFRASEAAAFAGYTEVDDEIGFDRKLNLPNYYEMCNGLVDYISSRDDLLKKVARKLKQKGKDEGEPELTEIDPNHHILAYDIIRDAYQHDFYKEKAANRKSKISTVQYRAIEKTQKRALLLDEREEVVDEYDEISSLEAGAKMPDLVGRKVRHEAYGKGKVTEKNGRYLKVEFEDGMTKKFVLPTAIVGGFLDFGSAKLTEAAEAMERVKDRKKDIADRLTAIDVQLQMLE